MRCEDFPCCGHGPAPYGDGGGCPNENGQFNCVTCGELMPKGAHSAICDECRRTPKGYCDDDGEWYGPEDCWDEESGGIDY